jgi:hypothetical protein
MLRCGDIFWAEAKEDSGFLPRRVAEEMPRKCRGEGKEEFGEIFRIMCIQL